MDISLQFVKNINKLLWDNLLIFLLVGTGIYFTIRLSGIQFRRLKTGLGLLFSGLGKSRQKKEGKADKKTGSISSFQALTTAIAAQVGTGNIAGAATALVAGGPGAIFWMWLSALFGMATIFAEAVLSQTTRFSRKGHILGGPHYYIRAIFKGKFGRFLAGFFSVAIILALGFTGNMVQSNSISAAFSVAFGLPPLAIGIAMAAVASFIFIGGLKRIAAMTEKVVPFMALLYILGSLFVIFSNGNRIGTAFYQIFAGAFAPQAVLGSVAGITIKQAVRYGVARGLFSNEAGMGSTPHAHATADVKHPAEQGIIAMVGVFIDTFIILTLTALVILTSGILDSIFQLPASGRPTGVALAQTAYESAMGPVGAIFIAICILFFGFTTIVSWYYFGEVNFRTLFGDKFVPLYSIIVLGFIIAGSILKVELVWELSDTLNGLMVLPNLIALIAGAGLVKKILQEHDKGLLKQPLRK